MTPRDGSPTFGAPTSDAPTSTSAGLRRLPSLTSVVVTCALAALAACGPSDTGGTDGASGHAGIVELPAADSPLVTFRIGFQTGSVDDPPGKNGLNALTALMIGRGGTESMSYEAITEALYPWSASIRAQSDKEMTVLVGEVHGDHLEPFFAVVRDLVTAPGFDQADFDRNREFLANSVASGLRGSDDEELGKQALNVLMHAGHPYETPAIGTEEGLASLTVEDVRAFYASHYTRARALIGIGGGYPDGFVDRIEAEILDALPAGEGTREPIAAPPAPDGYELLIVEKEAIATAVSIGFPIDITRADDDFFPLMVANSYFGEHRTFNGLLMNVMRGARGLNYGDYSYIENFIQDGGSRLPTPNIPRSHQFFSVWIRPVPHHNAHFALRQAIRELRRLVEDGLTQEDFEATREFLLNYSRLYVQTTSRRLGYRMDSAIYGGGDFVDEIAARLPALTLDDVNGAIRRHLQADNLAVAVVTRDAEAFRDALLANEPAPPAYNAEVTDAIRAEDAEIEVYELPFTAERTRIVPVDQMFRAID